MISDFPNEVFQYRAPDGNTWHTITGWQDIVECTARTTADFRAAIDRLTNFVDDDDKIFTIYIHPPDETDDASMCLCKPPAVNVNYVAGLSDALSLLDQ